MRWQWFLSPTSPARLINHSDADVVIFSAARPEPTQTRRVCDVTVVAPGLSLVAFSLGKAREDRHEFDCRGGTVVEQLHGFAVAAQNNSYQNCERPLKQLPKLQLPKLQKTNSEKLKGFASQWPVK